MRPRLDVMSVPSPTDRREPIRRVLLVNTYELGRQPVHLAAAAGHLTAAGFAVSALDLAVEDWDDERVDAADAIAISVPMHTASRLALEVATRIRTTRGAVPLAAFGLYAPVVAEQFAAWGGVSFAGEFGTLLVRWAGGESSLPTSSRQRSSAATPPPRRQELPALERYAMLDLGTGELRLAAAVEATRGCAHRCRHCPVPTVYDGRIRIVPEASVLADIDALVAAGARHITFADPDFLNGPRHARRIVDGFHGAHPDVTFDCTVKVEHIVRDAALWSTFADSGLLFVTSAFESVDDVELRRLAKGHTAADAATAVTMLRAAGVDVRPTWLPFTPWTTPESLVGLVDFVADLDLVPNVDPIQYPIRLLLPPGSLLLDEPGLASLLTGRDPDGLGFTWRSPDPELDALQERVAARVEAATVDDEPVAATYAALRSLFGAPRRSVTIDDRPRPRLTESWFCCAEPSCAQRAAVEVVGPELSRR